MHSHPNARLTHKTGSGSSINTSKTAVPWLNWLQKQASASAVPTSGWPATAQAVQLLWRIDGVFAAPSGGRSIRGICSKP